MFLFHCASDNAVHLWFLHLLILQEGIRSAVEIRDRHLATSWCWNKTYIFVHKNHWLFWKFPGTNPTNLDFGCFGDKPWKITMEIMELRSFLGSSRSFSGVFSKTTKNSPSTKTSPGHFCGSQLVQGWPTNCFRVCERNHHRWTQP